MKTYINELGRRIVAAPVARCTFAGSNQRAPTGIVFEGEPPETAYLDVLAHFFMHFSPPRVAIPKPGDMAFRDEGATELHAWAWMPRAEFEAEFTAV